MASDQTLRAIITVLDKTAEPLHQINQRFAQMAAPVRHIGNQLGELAELTGLRRIGEHAREALEHVRHLGHGLLELAGPLAGLTAAASVAGLVEIAKSTAEFGEKLYFGAIMTGMATEQLAGWHYAANLANVDVTKLDRGFTYLNRNISEAARGKAKDVQAILTHMGFHNAQGRLVGTAAALKAVAAEAKHLVDSDQIQLATDMMAKLFGARAGAQLLPLFAQGPEELQKVLDDAKRHGIAPNAEQTKEAKEFADSYKQMAGAVEGLKIAIGNELFPVLRPVVERMTAWVDANRQWIATHVEEGIKSVGEALHNIDFAGILEGLKGVASVAGTVVEAVGGIGAAVVIVAGISLAPTILAFSQLGFAIAGAAAKFLLFPAAGFIVTLASLVPAITGATSAMAALDLAMDANPIGAVVVGLTTLAGIAYLIYEHWGGLVDFFKGLWEGVVAVFEWAWEKIKGIVAAIRDSINWITDHLNTLTLPEGKGGGPTFDEYGNAIGGGANPVKPQSFIERPSLLAQPGIVEAAATGAPAERSETKVTVDIKGLPPGSTVATESRGPVIPDVNVGHAFAF